MKIMNKILAIIGLTLAITWNTNAQIQYGVKLGFGLSDQKVSGINEVNADYVTKPKLKMQLGGVAEYYFTERIGIHTGLLFTGKGANLQFSESNFFGNFTVDANFKLIYTEIPLNVIYKTELSTGLVLAFNAGPSFGLALSGKVNTKDSDGDKDSRELSIGTSNSNDIKPGDISFNFGVGAEFEFYSMPFRAGLNYGLGLSNILPYEDNNSFMKNRMLSLSLIGFLDL